MVVVVTSRCCAKIVLSGDAPAPLLPPGVPDAHSGRGATVARKLSDHVARQLSDHVARQLSDNVTTTHN
jgi:hypothetical protein